MHLHAAVKRQYGRTGVSSGVLSPEALHNSSYFGFVISYVGGIGWKKVKELPGSPDAQGRLWQRPPGKCQCTKSIPSCMQDVNIDERK